MKKIRATAFITGMLLVAASALSETPWRKSVVQLGWVKQPNPDETGKSSAQRTKLFGKDTLEYTVFEDTAAGQPILTEKYSLLIQDDLGTKALFNVIVPKGTSIGFSGTRCYPGDVCEWYSVDRLNGKRASVEYTTNAPPSASTTGLVNQ